jgi:hypothetical protein
VLKLDRCCQSSRWFFVDSGGSICSFLGEGILDFGSPCQPGSRFPAFISVSNQLTPSSLKLAWQSYSSRILMTRSTLSHLYHQYAAQHWVDHAQFENVSLRVEDGMRRLFDPSKPYFAGWLKSHNMDKCGFPFFPLCSPNTRSITP